MKTTLGNLLLLAGTVLGGIAAANSARPWRWVAVGEAMPEEILYRDVDVVPDGAQIFEVQLVAAGVALDAATVERLRRGGVERVQVKNPARDFESLPVDPQVLRGRILHAEVTWAEAHSVAEGTALDAGLVEGWIKDGVTQIVAREGGGEAQTLALPEAGGRLALGAPLEGFVLAADLNYERARMLKAGSYLGDDLLEALAGSDVGQVSVRMLRGWKLADWEWRWVFMLSMAGMVLGVLLKRSAGDGVAAGEEDGEAIPTDAEQMRAVLGEIEGKVVALAAEADALSAAELHQRLDPLLGRDLPRFVEGREVLKTAYGVRIFTGIMGPFSAAERTLNRAWSAAVDDNAEESRDCVKRGAAGLGRARAAFPQD